ncbi:MAG: efflux RND transporter periplasmic adaptor subunit [Myxococcota bacterium]
MKIVTRLLLPGVITLSAVAGAVMLVQSAESAEREPPAAEAPLVEYIRVQRESVPPRLPGTGVVEPAREAMITPELSGRIVYLSPSLVVGGRFEEGEVLLRLDKRDYQIALTQQRSQVEQAKVELELEKAHGKVARKEWELMGSSEEAGRLASRVPQREAAQLKVDSAKSSLRRSKIDLERTTIRAPFNATVTSESVEIGEIASPGGAVATLVGTDELLVRVSVPVESLALLDIPGYGADEGSVAIITQRLGRRGTVQREGRVIRLVNELDPDSRMAQVLVEVKSPLDPRPGELPLLPGAFVEVELSGAPVPDVVPVPRVAVFEGRHVWVMNDDETLTRRELTIGWGDDTKVYVTAGLAEGDRIVLTPPSPVLDGMKVRGEAAAEEGRVSAVIQDSTQG